VVAEADGRGGSRLTRLRSQAPLVLRATARAVYLVGGAGGPLAGDDLTVEIDVGPGAELTVRSAAASVALPGARPAPSRLRVRAHVGAGGTLRWMPEPVVAARGCDHRMQATVDVDGGGGLIWWEELVLGRDGEASGSVTSRVHVDVDGRPLLRSELALGPAHRSAATPAVAGTAGAAGSVLMVHPDWTTHGPVAPTAAEDRAAVLVLDGPGAQVVALADHARALRQTLEAATVATAGSQFGGRR
jgi:urease accessory protein